MAVVFLLGVAGANCNEPELVPEREYLCTDDDALDLYQARIAPLLTAEQPSTCNQCHLSGIDLGIYTQADPCATMACMVEQGIVDLDDPEASLVLTWIVRAEDQGDGPNSDLITQDVIDAEHDAMLQWIEYNAGCGADVCAPVENPCGGTTAAKCERPPSGIMEPPREFDDPGDCSEHTLEAAFSELVYPWRGRCTPCHTDAWDGPPEDAPRWMNEDGCELGSLLTMRRVVDTGLVDAANPSASLLLLKPLAVADGGVEHGGHDKFADTTDPAYIDFLRWIERWAACQQ
jgi:hypothetical protein